MAKHTTPTRWTYEEFARLPEGDGNRYEIIAGELYVTPSPRPLHQRVVTGLTVALENHVRAHALGKVYVGPIDVLFAEGDYMAPDIVYVREGRSGVVSQRGVESAPDLIVEVLSPSTASRDRILKRERYQHFGVPEYWVVDPVAREILVYRASGDLSRPEVSRERLTWRPAHDAPALELDLSALFGDA
jgi:Uma2 family endonuclease